MAGTVVFESVWKKFRRGETHDSLRDLLPALVRGAFGRRGPATALREDEFWALRDVSFEVRPGQALGIIGPNGAGKSTSLKLLSRILRADRGRTAVTGRVGALIEIAAGFHPDLTGRENVFLQGAIMGLAQREIRREFDAIVNFAGMADFIDTPVKRYSSGMNARLGFAIAAHLHPDVLLIDEVLSVGDTAFQKRCVERAHAFKREGVPIVFVSHNLQTVAELCDRAVYLHREVKADGETGSVIRRYLEGVAGGLETRGPVTITGARLTDAATGAPVTTTEPGRRLRLRVSYRAKQAIPHAVFGLLLHRSTDHLVVYDANFSMAELGLDGLAAGQEVSVDFDLSAHVTRGQYHFECHVLHPPSRTFFVRQSPVALLTVAENRTFAGVSDLAVSGNYVK